MSKTNEDLVGNIWTTGRPPFPNSPINALPYKFSGKKSNFRFYLKMCIICVTDVRKSPQNNLFIMFGLAMSLKKTFDSIYSIYLKL